MSFDIAPLMVAHLKTNYILTEEKRLFKNRVDLRQVIDILFSL